LYSTEIFQDQETHRLSLKEFLYVGAPKSISGGTAQNTEKGFSKSSLPNPKNLRNLYLPLLLLNREKF
jgi:hypothetical protein